MFEKVKPLGTFQYGLPYQGSKRKLSTWLVEKLLEQNPNAEYFVDLFGGGGSVTLRASHYLPVLYNEINPAIADLFKVALQNKLPSYLDKVWVSRKAYKTLREHKNWLGGYVATCWSFGNNLRSYIYGEHREALAKQALKAYIKGMEGDYSYAKRFCRSLDTEFKPFKSRIEFLRLFNREEKLLFGRLRHLTHLNQVRRIPFGKGMFPIVISNKDYREVVIPKGAVVYCDIPYNTGRKYYNNKFDYDAFYNWAKKQPFNVYISEYNGVGELIAEREHVQNICDKINNKKIKERIYKI